MNCRRKMFIPQKKSLGSLQLICLEEYLSGKLWVGTNVETIDSVPET